MKKHLFFIFMFSLAAYLNALPSIMVTGYWNPTGQMIAPFSQNPELNPDGWIGENWQELGYDVYSYFPVPDLYTGDFEVDYQDTWEDFWLIVEELHPLAIISFGAGAGPWEIETKARNLTNWAPDNEAPYLPTPNPPDDSVPVGFVRYTTLPVEAIESAVEDGTTLNAWIDWNGYAGSYLCEYMFYLETWYQNMHSSNYDEFPCLSAGFIHVSAIIPVWQAQEGAFITVETVLEYLNTFVDISGLIVSNYIDPSGALLTLNGTAGFFNITIDNSNGTFYLPYVPSGLYDVAVIHDDFFYGYTQMDINHDNTEIELELEDWSLEDQFTYAEDTQNIYQGYAYSNYEIACRLTQEEFSANDGSVFGKVSFRTPTSSDSCSLTVKIYEADAGSTTPGEIVYEQEESGFPGNEWLEHWVLIPVPIDLSMDYWIGYQIESVNGRIGWYDNGPVIADKGAWIKRGIWRQLDYFVDDPGNWQIKAHAYSPVNNQYDDYIIYPVLEYLRNFPNPFNPVTKISYGLSHETTVKLNIYNIKGQKVRTLLDAWQDRGEHCLEWDGRNDHAEELSSGIYFYRLSAEGHTHVRKMVLLK
ncbi:MAG: T9SS type A sorting domain-containing protein [Candidatus Cloacimonetes bacterium]|nr:T9SS type A sorting domain-containing protein [Candidatus Cloacimonadota bacterium]